MAESHTEAVSIVASQIFEKLFSHPASVIGLATGRTMEPVYAKLAELVETQNPDLSKSFFFMLDEYLGLSPEHPSSFKSYISQRVLNPLKLHSDQFAFPPAHTPNREEAGGMYEQTIRESGGIDLQLLGIGRNGHIGFNEPGSLKSSRTRIVELTPETVEANRSDIAGDFIPTHALSMGIETILEAKSLLMLATGKSKAETIKYLLNHHDDSTCPATYLKSHSHFTLVLDPEAASKINLKI